MAGMGQPVGIMLPSIESQMRIMRVPPAAREELSRDVQLIGRTIISLQNKEAEKKGKKGGKG